jgi:monoamine oxidase
MAARELARAGKRVVILEARERCGGRIYPLASEEFGYPAEGGAEFVHGAAPHTLALAQEAGLPLSWLGGTRWRAAEGALMPDEGTMPHEAEFRGALSTLKADLPIGEFLARHFGDQQHADLRRAISRMVEGYDAADPSRASTFALRDEWMEGGLAAPRRIVGGYGALIAFLVSECRRYGVAIHLGTVVTAIDAGRRWNTVRCRGGRAFQAGAAILTVPLPLLPGIALPPAAQAKAAAVAGNVGFGNVIKVLLRFTTTWWADCGARDLSDLSFVVSSAPVPTWWTQQVGKSVLTGWLAGPRAEAGNGLAEAELVEMALGSLAEIFGVPQRRLREWLVASRAINWGRDVFTRGGYSYATPRTRETLSMLAESDARVFFAGEALYAGPEMGTVEAALASGWQTTRVILSRRPR